MFKAGTGEVDITPDRALRVAGMLNPPLVEQARWRLFARAFVFEGGGRPVALVVLDNLFLATPLVAEFREAVTQGTPILPQDVMITCTHTHRAPFAAALMDEEIDFTYVNWMRARAAEAVRLAVERLRPAVLRVGSIQAPGWTFNRRQVYRSELYGEQVGTQGPQDIGSFLRNEGPEDNELVIAHILGSDGCSLGGLVNFACHTTVMGGELVYSADYAGTLTEALSNRLGGIFGFLQGAAGNLWAINTGAFRSNLDRDYLGSDHAIRMGAALAEKGQQALLENCRETGAAPAIRQVVLPIAQRRVERAQVELAQWYLEHAPGDLDQQAFTRQIYGHDFTFFNNDPTVQKWFSRETIGMWEWQRRVATRELVEQVEVQVLSLGDVAIVGLPGEVFTELGLEIKAGSPFPRTIVADLANGWHGYIPTREAFPHGGYETRLGYTSRLVPEAGERMVAAATDLLLALSTRE